LELPSGIEPSGSEQSNHQRRTGPKLMNNPNTDSISVERPGGAARSNRQGSDELGRLKRELIQAEVRLGRARATVTVTELEVKDIHARIRELAR